VSVAGGALLPDRAHGAPETAAAVVYSASLSALFGMSALYHRGTWTVAMRLRLRHLDQASERFPIIGTSGTRRSRRSLSANLFLPPQAVQAGRLG
jgi:hemolysin III